MTSGRLAQEQILQAVDDLFYHQGARAVGVEAVVKQAGVNKMMLYRQFASKDALLLHYLERMEVVFWAHFDASLDQHPDDPAKQLVQFFIDLAQRATQPGFRGCPFVNVAAEFPDPSHPARRKVADNKARLFARLSALALAAQADEPEKLASGLALLIEGAYAASQTFLPGQALMVALPGVAQTMVETACHKRLTFL